MLMCEFVATRSAPSRAYALPCTTRKSENTTKHRSGTTSKRRRPLRPRSIPLVVMSMTKWRRLFTLIAAPSSATQKKRKRATSSDQVIGICSTKRVRTCSVTTMVSRVKMITAIMRLAVANARNQPGSVAVTSALSAPGGTDFREEVCERKLGCYFVLDLSGLRAQLGRIDRGDLHSELLLHLRKRRCVALGHETPLPHGGC